MALLKFLKGSYSNLNNTAINEGQILICNDTAEMFIDVAADKRIKIGDFTVVANITALEALDATAVPTSRLYYVEEGNILARSNGTQWIQVNKQPSTEELKTLLGLGSAAYTDSTAYDAAGSAQAVREYVGEIPVDAEGKAIADSVVAYINKKTDGIATSGNLEALGARVTTAEGKISDLETASAKHVEKEEGKSLISDSEITRLSGMSDGANKVENVGGGKIKIDGEEVVVYAHPDKHSISDVTGLQEAIDEAKQAGTDAADALDSYKGEMVTTLAGKQDVIPENTYDTYGAASQALADAKSDASTKDAQVLVDAKAYVDEEDKFEIDMNTIEKFGGIAENTNLNGLTTHEILKKLLYPHLDPIIGGATASPNGGTYEKGVTKTITQVSISITKRSNPITSVALYNGSTLLYEKTGDAVKNGGTITFNKMIVKETVDGEVVDKEKDLAVVVPTEGNQLTVKVTYPDVNGEAKTESKNTSAMTFVYPYYIGICEANAEITEELVKDLPNTEENGDKGAKKIQGKADTAHEFSYTQKSMVFAFPKSYGKLSAIKDPSNFELKESFTIHEVDVTGLDGVAVPYYVYVSGVATNANYKVTFKK